MTSNVTDWKVRFSFKISRQKYQNYKNVPLKVVLKMDMDVATDLGADARGAGMIAKTERELILTKPSAYTTWKAKQVTF